MHLRGNLAKVLLNAGFTLELTRDHTAPEGCDTWSTLTAKQTTEENDEEKIDKAFKVDYLERHSPVIKRKLNPYTVEIKPQPELKNSKG